MNTGSNGDDVIIIETTDAVRRLAAGVSVLRRKLCDIVLQIEFSGERDAPRCLKVGRPVYRQTRQVRIKWL